ncbi:MAG: tyrosine-type recombinase/integrase [Saprospiraceae bacterium]|nr:tyrosine-type recombinase/integrase [Saprospiraceae bacterium]
MIYSAGLRGQEVINLRISDIDFERKTIHIRQSKYKRPDSTSGRKYGYWTEEISQSRKSAHMVI